MSKQTVNIVGINTLYNILEEIKENLSFNIVHYNNGNEFLELFNQGRIDNNNFLIIAKHSSRELLLKNEKIKKNNVFLIINKGKISSDIENFVLSFPIEIISLIEKINIQLIKQKYDNQSKIKINNYYLDLNSRVIFKEKIFLKLTEREVDIVLFLHKQKEPKKINILQKQVWGYSSDLETHTVETHIYRLRKKINDNFKDNDFIISTDDGYIIK